jgi:hypothetical protein
MTSVNRGMGRGDEGAERPFHSELTIRILPCLSPITPKSALWMNSPQWRKSLLSRKYICSLHIFTCSAQAGLSLDGVFDMGETSLLQYAPIRASAEFVSFAAKL